MKKAEKILAVLLVISTVMSFLHIIFSGLLITVSFTSTAAFYLFLNRVLFSNIPIRDIYKKSKNNDYQIIQRVGSFILGYSFFCMILGVLFKIQFWPNAQMMLLRGISLHLVVVIVYVVLYLKNKSEFYVELFKRSAVIGSIAIILWLIPQIKIVEFKHRDDPAYIESYKNSIENQNK